MRLASFIHQQMEPILHAWEEFAMTLLPAAAGMSSLTLRDHAAQILEAVAADLEVPQDRHQQSEKSKGRAPLIAGAAETAAQTHAVLRARAGFDVNQLVAEYRALRASVLRLWLDHAELDPSGVEDMIRFNEAIDQAVAESVGCFQSEVERSRNLLLGMLGHDMRNPLSTILSTASYLATLNAGDKVTAAAGRLIRSGASMQSLLDDLVDFNRTKLGLGINIRPRKIDLREPIADEVDQFRVGHQDRPIELDVAGDCNGLWDGKRLQQLLRNLLANAIKYGAAGTPVRVELHGLAEGIVLRVSNSGPTIEPALASEIFDPLKRGRRAPSEDGGDLGLGLFIVREIARAHGGDVSLQSGDNQTTFTLRLPRSSASA